MFAKEISEMDLTLEDKVSMHLRSNCYPPVPLSMVKPCVEAIRLVESDELYTEVALPDGVTYKGGHTTAPAWVIVDQHRLSFFLEETYEEESEA
jgi:hypothetical protein